VTGDLFSQRIMDEMGIRSDSGKVVFVFKHDTLSETKTLDGEAGSSGVPDNPAKAFGNSKMIRAPGLMSLATRIT
jgi:hypothetical protein